MAIAEHVREQLSEAGLRLETSRGRAARPSMPNIGEAFPRPYADGAAIEKDPEYGRIVCFCERVTRGSCATRSARRWRPPISTGCAAARAPVWVAPGFFCGAELAALLAGRRGERPGRDRRGRGRPGLSAAIELRRRGVPDVLVLERESEAGTSRGTRATRASGCVTCPEQCRSELRAQADRARAPRRRRAPHRDDDHRPGPWRPARADLGARARAVGAGSGAASHRLRGQPRSAHWCPARGRRA